MNKIFCLWCFVLNFENRERTQSPFSQVDWSNSRFSALDIYYNTFLFLFGWIQLNLTLSRDGLNLSIKIFLDSHLKDFFLQNSKKKLLRAIRFLMFFIFKIRCFEYPAFKPVWFFCTYMLVSWRFNWRSWSMSLMYQALSSLYWIVTFQKSSSCNLLI